MDSGVPGAEISFEFNSIKTVNISCLNCLTNTVDSSVVQVVPKGAFAAEGSIGVDADAVLADAWVIQTLIHVCRKPAKALK